MKLVIATRNAHKLEEIQAIFDFSGVEVSSAFDYPEVPDVVEDGETLEANAIKKAREISAATGCWALADDSGLEVAALDGAPGVYSARYAGEHCSYADNNEKLKREMRGQTDRSARFRTVLALVDPAAPPLEVVRPGVVGTDEARGAPPRVLDEARCAMSACVDERAHPPLAAAHDEHRDADVVACQVITRVRQVRRERDHGDRYHLRSLPPPTG